MNDFAAGIDGRIGVNVGLQVGHCALRRHVLGDDAGTRTATDDEIAAMQELLRAALDEGAVGFSSSQLEMHVDQHGNPVPSNLAAADELVALASVFADRPHGVIEFISRSNLEGHDDADRALMLAMCEASGKPMNVNPIVQPADAGRRVEAWVGVRRRGARRWAPGAPAVAAAADAGVLRAPRHLPLRRDGSVPRGAHRRRPPRDAARAIPRCATACALPSRTPKGARLCSPGTR